MTPQSYGTLSPGDLQYTLALENTLITQIELPSSRPTWCTLNADLEKIADVKTQSLI